jgi:O-antigen/teichoic acid export membrane protein
MKEASLKSQAAKGMFWNAIENFSIQAGQFIIGIILARLLMPTDYGLIGMLAIFIAIAQTFISSGMGTALVQKKDRTDIDYSTVFVFNFAVSVIIYLILFFLAPLIADFYAAPKLVLLTRVLCLNIVINSLSLVQTSRLTIDLDFKTMAKVNVITVVAGGIFGIILAYNGFGVWSLVFQNLFRSVLSVIMLAVLSRWKLSLKFSKSSFKALFGFGSKILGASLVATLFQNIYKVIIGKAYSPTILGYYSQGFTFADVSAGTVTNILQKVTFPILSSIQDDEKRLISVYRKMLGITAYFIFPVMTLLALLGDPLIRFFLTEKWLPAIPLMQWLCFARIVYPISVMNLSILNAKGRSDLFLKVDLSKFPLMIVALIITIPLGIKAVVIGHFVTSVIAFFINAYLPGKLFSYGPFAQLKDMAPKIIATAIMAILVYLVLSLVHSELLKLIIGGITGVFSYFLVSHLMKIEEVNEVKEMFTKFINLSKRKIAT